SRLCPPIWPPAAALDALPRAGADGRGRTRERFRRPGAWWDSRHHADRAWRIWHRFSPRRQGAGEGSKSASVLQMGGYRAPARHAALELSQIPHRRDGRIAAVFATEIEPMDARVIDAI